MGSFSIWHWIIMLMVLAIPAVIGLIIWLVIRATTKPAAESVPTAQPPFRASPQSSVEARLQELASLWAKGLITDSEYEQQRSVVLSSV